MTHSWFVWFAIVSLLSAPFAVRAQESGDAPSSAAEVQLPDITTAVEGVSILPAESGEFRLVSVSTAAYRQNDKAHLLAAQKVAEAKAKAALARFLNETVSTETTVEDVSRKCTVVTEEGKSVSKTHLTQIVERIRISSRQFLKGLVVLQTADMPGEGTAGTFRVMMGVSSVSLEASAAATDALEKARAQ